MIPLPNFYPKQAQVAAGIATDPRKFQILLAGRGFGKDVAITPVAVDRLVAHQPPICWIAHDHAENTKTLELIKKVDRLGAFNYHSSAPYKISFGGGSILFFSSNSVNALRGKNFFKYIFINEAAFMDDETWDKVVSPICSFAKKVIIWTTPNGDNWFKKFWERAVETGKHATYFGTAFDNPYQDFQWLEEQRLLMPPALFNQEYLAEFIDDAGSAFNDIDRIFCLPDFAAPTAMNFAGIDLAQLNDYTVLTIINEHGELVYFDRFNQLPSYDMISERIAPILKQFRYPRTVVEDNGMGGPIAQQIRDKAGNNVFPTSVMGQSGKTGISKEGLVGQLNYSINSGQLKAPQNLAILRDELRRFKYKKTGQTVKYGADSGHHDDCVISLALANWSRLSQFNKFVK